MCHNFYIIALKGMLKLVFLTLTFLNEGMFLMYYFSKFQQTQRPDLARLMQIHASAAGGVPPGPAGLPPGLLGGPGTTPPSLPAGLPGLPAGLPTSIALLAGIPSSLAQAGPHPAFASLLAQQKPNPDIPSLQPKDEVLKRAIADTNGSKYRHLCTQSH